MIHEEIVTYEVAKLAKEKGFDWKCRDYYNMDSELRVNGIYALEYTNSQIDEGYITAPTQSLLQRWLREEKGYYVYPYYDNNEFKWTYSIREKTGDMWILLVGETPNFDVFEESMEAGLKYALENLV